MKICLYIFTIILIIFSNQPVYPFAIRLTEDGKVIKWNKTNISYYLDDNGSDDITDGSDIQAVLDAFDGWMAVTCTNLHFSYDGTITNTDILPISGKTNGKNELMWVENDEWIYGTYVLGINVSVFDSSGNIFEADIAFNGYLQNWSTTGEPNKYDIMSVAIHEIGHMIGLQHVLEGYFGPGDQPTMAPYYDPFLGEQSLEEDDKKGICFLYPEISYNCSTNADCPYVLDSKSIWEEYYTGKLKCESGECAGLAGLAMSTGRTGHSATLLMNGSVLVAGGGTEKTEIYNTPIYEWNVSGDLLGGTRSFHTATLLSSGKVFITGGLDAEGMDLATTKIFDPMAGQGTWTSGPDLNDPRQQHTATLLKDGKVLIVGGIQKFSGRLASCELYDPQSETMGTCGFLQTVRGEHTAVLLKDGKVLLCGGSDSSNQAIFSCELYNPDSNKWSYVKSMNQARTDFTATMLFDGRVLVAGGKDGSSALVSTEVYDPNKDLWTSTEPLDTARYFHSSLIGPYGMVFVIGGWTGSQPISSIEVYDPFSDTWSLFGTLKTPRYQHTSTLIWTYYEGGKMLVVGGTDGTSPLNGVEVFHILEPVYHIWSKSFGGLDLDHGYSLAAYSNKNVYVTGNFLSDKINFGGENIINAGNEDIYIAKFDSYGNHIWSKGFGGSYRDYAKFLAVDSNENVYVIGDFESFGIDFGGGILGNAGWADIYVAKFDSSGNHIWSKGFGGDNYDFGNSLAVDSNGNIYIIGDFWSPAINFGDVSLGNAGGTDIYIAKFDSSGNHIWSKSFGGSSMDFAKSLAIDGNGNVYITGEFESSSINFDGKSLIKAGGTDIYVAKFDSYGNYLWSKSFGGDNDDFGNSLAVDGNGNVYVTGDFESSSINFDDKSLIKAGGTDIYIAKFDSSGNHIWSKSFGGSSMDSAKSLAVDSNGNVYITGEFESANINFGGGNLNNFGESDIFIAKFGAVAGFSASVFLDPPPDEALPDQEISLTGSNFRVSEGTSGNSQSSHSDHPIVWLKSKSTIRYISGFDFTDTQVKLIIPCALPHDNYSLGVTVNGNSSSEYPISIKGIGQGETCSCDEACQDNPPSACYYSAGKCLSGICNYEIQSTNCYIKNTCYSQNDKNPANQCQGCIPTTSKTTWSNFSKGASCDDSISCTYTDVCDGKGNCSGISYSCPSPAQCEQSVSCDGEGGCTKAFKEDGIFCTDGDACTYNDVCDGSGLCAGISYACEPNQCEQSSICDGKGTCAVTKKTQGASCDDEDACTYNDVCDGSGLCVGISYTCEPNQCEQSSICDGKGTCTITKKTQGASCDDEDACTYNDVCDGSGLCAGISYACEPNQCEQSSICDGNGTCTVTNKTQGASCDDVDACTYNDVCDGSGLCAGTSYTCPSPAQCEQFVICDGEGGCDIVYKPEGTPCADDGIPCTSDLCDGNGVCLHLECPNGSFCDIDGLCKSCNTAEHCGEYCKPCPEKQYCDTSSEKPQCREPESTGELGYSGGGLFGCSFAGSWMTSKFSNGVTPMVLFLVLPLFFLLRRRCRLSRMFLLICVFMTKIQNTAGQQSPSPFNSERFMPAPGVQNVFTVYSTTAKNKGCYELSLIANHSQLSLRGMNGNDVVYDIIIYRQNIDLLATYGLIPKFDIGLALPFVVNQSGGSHQTKFGGFNTEFIKAKSFAFGDMRIIPKYTLLDNSKGGFGLGLLGQFTIPTGSNDAFFGNGQIGFEFRAAADFKHKDKLFAANIGYYICEGKDALNIHLGREFRYGIGLLYPTGQNNRLVLISEIFGAVDPPAEDRSWSSRNFPTEFLGLARYFFSSRIFGSIGGAIGLTDGVGTPQFRVIGMVGYSFEDTTEKKQVIFSSPTPELFPSPVKPPPLILTATEPNNGAKDVKRETPLILHFSENVNNASVHGSVIVKDISGTSQVITTEIEVKGNIVIVRPSSPEVWKEGAKIEATLTQGIVSSVANESGGQLKDAPIVIKFDVVLPPPPVVPKPVVDKVLATPVAPKHIVDKVLINETSIIISEPIFFETGKANILPSSYNILNKLSQAIKENSNILLVEVAGHSDNIGTDKKNLALSRSRADAVVKYLVRTGVDASRLIATGYSHCLPIGTNKTKEGRAKNRRVEFKILKKANPTSSPK